MEDGFFESALLLHEYRGRAEETAEHCDHRTGLVVRPEAGDLVVSLCENLEEDAGIFGTVRHPASDRIGESAAPSLARNRAGGRGSFRRAQGSHASVSVGLWVGNAGLRGNCPGNVPGSVSAFEKRAVA